MMVRHSIEYYEAHAQTISLLIEEITSSDNNADIIQRLRANDPTFNFLQITGENGYILDEHDFFVDRRDDLGWLGYFVGDNTTLQNLCICYSMVAETVGVHRLGDFIEGLSRNRSIETLFLGADLGRLGFRQMGDFFRNNKNLRELSFGSMDTIGVESARSIAFMLRQSQQSHLRELSLEESNASEEVLTEILTAISTHPLLEELNLYDNNLGRDGSVALGNALKACNNPQLKELYLGRNSIDDEGLLALADGMRKCHNLKDLDLSCNESITVDGFRSLSTLFQSEHCQLKYLGLDSMNIENDGAAALAAGLANLHSLTQLILDENSIGDDGARALGAGLADLHSLEDLHLEDNSIGDPGLQALVEGLVHCDNLKYLSLSNNTTITASGLRSLSTLLGSDSCSLTTLGLGGISFGDEGAAALADGLKDNISMKNFYIHNNSISDRGLQALVEGLDNCVNLTNLIISGNGSITASGLRSLSTLLQSESCSLVNICLEGIPFYDEGAAALADALKGNKSMKELYFDSSGVTSVGWKAFSKLLCDTSSVNTTYLSNHSLVQLERWSNGHTPGGIPPYDVKALLDSNKLPSKHVAIHKILKSHSDFDIEPFFEWKLKLLPHVVSWFERVRILVDEHSWISDESAEVFQSRQLSAMYNFVRGMPLVAIDGYRSRNNAATLAQMRKRKVDQLN
jgi:Ran GTPase-activating protein (RanGAP) involved in mRNA processing and transport